MFILVTIIVIAAVIGVAKAGNAGRRFGDCGHLIVF
jgi:hypothetical protein